MTQQAKQAIIKTLLYADIFDYCLTAAEVWKYEIAIKPYEKEVVVHVLESLKKIVTKSQEYFMLSGRGHLIKLRKDRERIGEEKLQKAQKVSLILSYIPTIRFIGVSGSVAIKNAKKEDDIDLFFITEKNTVWISRLLVTAILQLLGIRRKYASLKVSDSICANMFIGSEALAFFNSQQNIYIAHEIAQLFPMFCVENTYDEFLQKNSWISKFLPNWNPNNVYRSHRSFLRYTFVIFLRCFEVSVRIAQQLYMKNKKTIEFTTSSIIAFHPSNTNKKIVSLFEERCRRYGV